MAKKKHAEEHENLERWMVSYADFMTLLFATFVVLYALSQIDLAKFKDLKQSLQQAFSSPSVIQGAQSVLDGSGKTILDSGADPNSSMITPLFENAEVKYEQQAFDETQKDMKAGAEQGIQTTISERGLVITFLESFMFNSGSAQIKPSAYNALNKVGKILTNKFPDHLIRIEGHTDNMPIRSAQYPSNWELSSARASSIVRYLTGKYKIKDDRFCAVGYADSKPIASNRSEAGRTKNRRVEIVILRNKLSSSEPFTHDLNKARLEHIKNLQQKDQQILNKSKAMSDAAKKLMKTTGQSVESVMISEDPYDKETKRIENEVKVKEAKKRKELNLPATKLKQPQKVSSDVKNNIDKSKSKGYINDAVAELLKETGNSKSTLIIKAKK